VSVESAWRTQTHVNTSKRHAKKYQVYWQMQLLQDVSCHSVDLNAVLNRLDIRLYRIGFRVALKK
jgi:hypothetical protein